MPFGGKTLVIIFFLFLAFCFYKHYIVQLYFSVLIRVEDFFFFNYKLLDRKGPYWLWSLKGCWESVAVGEQRFTEIKRKGLNSAVAEVLLCDALWFSYHLCVSLGNSNSLVGRNLNWKRGKW